MARKGTDAAVWIRRLQASPAGWLAAAWRVLVHVLHRFHVDGCLRQAAGLSYLSLLALVPLFAIGLSVLAAFPVFDAARAELQEVLFKALSPRGAEAAAVYLTRFLANAEELTGPGLLILLITAVLLLFAINAAFNTIWRVAERRPWTVKLAVFWSILTLGPLLAGISLTLTSQPYAFVKASLLAMPAGQQVPFARLVSIGISAMGFALLFLIVPNRRVSLWHAGVGGALAAVLFELLKLAFAAYLSFFPSYEVIYGALATIPIFLTWTYLAWAAILLGAEVAATLPEWPMAAAGAQARGGAGERLALALTLLQRLRAAGRDEQRCERRTLMADLPASPTQADAMLVRLRAAGYAARASGGRWLLGRDLSSVTLADLLQVLELGLGVEDDWPPATRRVSEDLCGALAPWLERPLESLLTREDDGPRPSRLRAVEE